MKISPPALAKSRVLKIAVLAMLISGIAGAVTGTALSAQQQQQAQTVNCNAMPHMWSGSEKLIIDDKAGTVTFVWSLPEQAAVGQLPGAVKERQVTVDINAKNCNKQPGLEQFLATIRAQSTRIAQADCIAAQLTLDEIEAADDSQWSPDRKVVALPPLDPDDPNSLVRVVIPDQVRAALAEEC